MVAIDIPGVGTVDFPDAMSDEDIQRAIETEILPQARPRNAADDYWSGRQAEEDSRPSWLGNVARGAGERGLELTSGLLRTIGQVAEEGGDWLERRLPLGTLGSPGTPMTEEQIRADTNPLTPLADQLGNVSLGYEPRTTWEDVKGNWLNAVPFAAEQGLRSIPDMAAIALNLPGYVAARAGEIGQQRAANDGRLNATVGDIVAATPSAVASALLERYSTRGMLGALEGQAARSGRDLAREVGKAALREGGTEFLQEATDYLGETLGTERGATAGEALERGVMGAVAGAPFGGAVRGLTGSIQMWAASRGIEPTQENLEREAERGDPEALKILASAGMSAEQVAGLSPERAKAFVERINRRRAADAAREAPDTIFPADDRPPIAAPEGNTERGAQALAKKEAERLGREIDRRRQEQEGLAAGTIDPGAITRRTSRVLVTPPPPAEPPVVTRARARVADILALPADQHTPELADEYLRMKGVIEEFEAANRPPEPTQLGDRELGRTMNVGTSPDAGLTEAVKTHGQQRLLTYNPPRGMTDAEIAYAQALARRTEEEAARGQAPLPELLDDKTEGATLRPAPATAFGSEDRLPQDRDQLADQRRAEQDFRLTEHLRSKAGDTVRDVRAGGRPQGGVESQQEILMDEGRPVEVLSRRTETRNDGTSRIIYTVRRYDPRTGQPIPDENGEVFEYEIEAERLKEGLYGGDPRYGDPNRSTPRLSQEFEVAAEPPIVGSYKDAEGRTVRPSAAGRRADELQGLPRQTYRTTPPDPTVPGAEGPTSELPGQGPVPRSPRPEQGEGLGFDIGSGGRGPNVRGDFTRAEAAARAEAERRQRMWEQARKNERTNESTGEQTEWGKAKSRYENQREGYNSFFAGVDPDGWPQTDDDGFILSTAGGPIRFDQKSAMIKVLKQLRQQFPDAGIQPAPHPGPMKQSGRGGEAYWTLQATQPKPARGQAAPDQDAAPGPEATREGAPAPYGLPAPEPDSVPTPEPDNVSTPEPDNVPAPNFTERRVREGGGREPGRRGATRGAPFRAPRPEPAPEDDGGLMELIRDAGKGIRDSTTLTTGKTAGEAKGPAATGPIGDIVRRVIAEEAARSPEERRRLAQETREGRRGYIGDGGGAYDSLDTLIAAAGKARRTGRSGPSSEWDLVNAFLRMPQEWIDNATPEQRADLLRLFPTTLPVRRVTPNEYARFQERREQIPQVDRDPDRDPAATWRERQEANIAAVGEAVEPAKPAPPVIDAAEKALRERRVKPNAKAIGRMFDLSEAQAERLLGSIAARGSTVIRQNKKGGYRLVPQSDQPMSLLEFLMSKGGLKRDGDLVAMDAHKKTHPRYGMLVRKEGGGGLTLDEARELAETEGYIGEGTDDYNTTTIPDLLAAIEDELRGSRVLTDRTTDESPRGQMERMADRLDIDVQPDWTDAELEAEIDERLGIIEDALDTPAGVDAAQEFIDAMLTEMGIVPAAYREDFAIPFEGDQGGVREGTDVDAAEGGAAPEGAGSRAAERAASEAGGVPETGGPAAEGPRPREGADRDGPRRPPPIERTDQGDQYVLIGAASGREGKLTGKGPQKNADEGLFAKDDGKPDDRQIDLEEAIADKTPFESTDENFLAALEAVVRNEPAKLTKAARAYLIDNGLAAPLGNRLALTEDGLASLKDMREMMADDTPPPAAPEPEPEPKTVRDKMLALVRPVDPDKVPDPVNGKPTPVDIKPEERLLLLSCGTSKSKAPGTIPAIERYTGPRFNEIRKWIAANPGSKPKIVILSGRFGFIPDDFAIPDYDEKLSPEKARVLIAAGIDGVGTVEPRLVREMGDGRDAPIDVLADTVGGQPYRDVFILGGGDYTPVLKAAVHQLRQAGAIAPDAAIVSAAGAPGVQKKQAIDWLGGPTVETKAMASRAERVRRMAEPPPAPSASDYAAQQAVEEASRGRIMAALKAAGIKAWIGPRDKDFGRDFRLKILDHPIMAIIDPPAGDRASPKWRLHNGIAGDGPKAQGTYRRAMVSPEWETVEDILEAENAVLAAPKGDAVSTPEEDQKDIGSILEEDRNDIETAPERGTQREVDGIIVVATGNPDKPWAGGRYIEKGSRADWQPDTALGYGDTPEAAAADVQDRRRRLDVEQRQRAEESNRWEDAVARAKRGETLSSGTLKALTKYGDGKVTTGDAKAFLASMGLNTKQTNEAVSRVGSSHQTSGGAWLYDLDRIVRAGQNILGVGEGVRTIEIGDRRYGINEHNQVRYPNRQWVPRVIGMAPGKNYLTFREGAVDGEYEFLGEGPRENAAGLRNIIFNEGTWTAEYEGRTENGTYKAGDPQSIAETLDKVAQDAVKRPTKPTRRKRLSVFDRMRGLAEPAEPTAAEQEAAAREWRRQLDALAPPVDSVADARRVLHDNVDRGVLDKGTADGISRILDRLPTRGLKGMRLVVRDRLSAEEADVLGTDPKSQGEFITFSDDPDLRVLVVQAGQGSRQGVESFVHENAHSLFDIISDEDKAQARRIYDGLRVSRQALHTVNYAKGERFEEWFAESMVDYYVNQPTARGGRRPGVLWAIENVVKRVYKRIVDTFSNEKSQIDAFFRGLEYGLGRGEGGDRPGTATRRARRGTDPFAILTKPVATLVGESRAWRQGAKELARDTTELWRNRGQRANRQSFLGGLARAYFFSADGEFRSAISRFNSPTMQLLANTFHAQAGSGHWMDPELAKKLGMKLTSNATFDEAVTRRVSIELQNLDRILRPFREDRDAMDRIVTLVQEPNRRRGGPESDAASQISKMLAGLHKYMTDSGVDVGQIKNGYFPREVDQTKVIKDAAGFLEAATKAYKASGLDAKAAREAAEHWQTAVLYGGEGSPVRKGSGGSPSFVQSRILTKQADQILAEYYQRDPDLILGSYINRAVKRAEIARRFGDNWKNWGEIEKQIRTEDPAAGGMLNHLRDYAATAAGVQSYSVPGLVRSGSSLVRTFTTLSLLEKATFSSLAEAITPALRAGSALHFLPSITKTFNELRRELFDMPPSVALELAADVGAIAGSGVNSIMAARFAGGDPLGRAQARVLSSYFRRIGLEQWTNATRVAATERAAVFIRRLTRDIAGQGLNPKSSRLYLEELGVDPKQTDDFVKFVNGFGDDLPSPAQLANAGAMGEAYRTAVLRFVDQTIMRPGTTTRPRWASHPIGAIAFQLQAFQYAFAKNVLLRAGRLAHRAVTEKDMGLVDRTLLLAPLMMLPALALTQYIVGDFRDWLFMDPERRKAETRAAKIEKAISRAGLTGILDPYIQMMSGARYSKDPVSTLTGPFLGVFGQGLSAAVQSIANNSPGTNAAERKTAEALYDVLVEPVANIGLGYAPVAGVTALMTWGVLPAMRDEFVDSIAGERRGHKQQPVYGLSELVAGKQFRSRNADWGGWAAR